VYALLCNLVDCTWVWFVFTSCLLSFSSDNYQPRLNCIMWPQFCLSPSLWLSKLFCNSYAAWYCILQDIHCVMSQNSELQTAPCGIWGVMCPWFICWFWRHIYIVCLFTWLPPLTSFFIYLFFLIYLLRYLFLWV